MARLAAGLEMDAGPFANLREKKRTQRALMAEGMKECRWLRPGPELVAQIEFTEWTPDDEQPDNRDTAPGTSWTFSFVGLREDKEVVR